MEITKIFFENEFIYQRIFWVISVEKFLCSFLLNKNIKDLIFLFLFCFLFIKPKIQKENSNRKRLRILFLFLYQKYKKVLFLYFISFYEVPKKILFLVPRIKIKIQKKKESYFLKKWISDVLFYFLALYNPEVPKRVPL